MNKSVKTIYLDMDGTITNLYGYPDWLKRLQEEDATPYEGAKPLGDMERLNAVLAATGAVVGVVSWVSKGASLNYARAIRKAKQMWIRRYLPCVSEFHAVKYGTPKHLVIARKTDCVLLDDEQMNCIRFEDTGKRRHGIQVHDFNQLLREIELAA